MPQATYQDTPFDVLASRVRQVKGVLNAIQNTFDDDGYPRPKLFARRASCSSPCEARKHIEGALATAGLFFFK